MAEPAITLRAAHDSGPGNLPFTRVVVHATCPGIGYPKASAPGQASATAKYFQEPATPGSTQYVCDPETEEHCVPDDVIAWGAPPNPHSVHVEICGEASYTREQWLSPQVWPAVARAAARVAELCDRGGLPKVKRSATELLAGAHGVCGHVDVSQAWRQTDHTDPGPGFPWPEFMTAVLGGEEDDMTPEQLVAVLRSEGISGAADWSTVQRPDGTWPVGAQAKQITVDAITEALRSEGVSGAGDVARLAAAVAQQQPAQLAAALPADFAKQLLAELGKLLATTSS